MSRIRSIKPEFWSSSQVAKCSVAARLMFIGLWNFSDDAGRMEVDEMQIKMRIFAGDAFGIPEIHGMLSELSVSGLITEYEIKGIRLLQVTGWYHQLINRPAAPKYPNESGLYVAYTPPSDAGSVSAHGGLTDRSLTAHPRGGAEGWMDGGIERSPDRSSDPDQDSTFTPLASTRPLERRSSERNDKNATCPTGDATIPRPKGAGQIGAADADQSGWPGEAQGQISSDEQEKARAGLAALGAELAANVPARNSMEKASRPPRKKRHAPAPGTAKGMPGRASKPAAHSIAELTAILQKRK